MMMIALYRIIVFLALMEMNVDCEIFSAVDELEKLAVDEKLIIEELKVLAKTIDNDYVNR